MTEFTEKMQADHAEALRGNATETAKAQTENARLRECLAKIGGFARSWALSIKGQQLPNIIDKLNVIETTCKSALEGRPEPTAPLTYVNVGGEIYAGNIINENHIPDYPDWVEIEIVDIDPTAGRMSVTGPLARFQGGYETVN